MSVTHHYGILTLLVAVFVRVLVGAPAAQLRPKLTCEREMARVKLTVKEWIVNEKDYT